MTTNPARLPDRQVAPRADDGRADGPRAGGPRAGGRAAALLVLLVVLLPGCRAEPPAPPAYRARPVVVVERFAVEREGSVLGHVVHLEIQDPAEPVRFYRIVDDAGRWLGHATAIGRFSRRVPFQEDEEDIGVWSLAHGTARLFGVERVALRALPAEAAAKPPR